MSIELQTAVRRRTLDLPVREDLREAADFDKAEWDFDSVFERACTNVQVMFLEAQKLVGHLIVGLKGGPLVVMPFSWKNEDEKVMLFDRLARNYQGQADFYVHATESSLDTTGVPARPGAEPPRIIGVAGADRVRISLARCWEIKCDPVLRLVEREAPYFEDETLADILFSSRLDLDPMPNRR